MTALFLVLHSEFGGCTWPRNLRQHLHPRWGSPGLPPTSFPRSFMILTAMHGNAENCDSLKVKHPYPS